MATPTRRNLLSPEVFPPDASPKTRSGFPGSSRPMHTALKPLHPEVHQYSVSGGGGSAVADAGIRPRSQKEGEVSA
eukprot:3455771-Pyramimonas_sp.AAC.1